MSTSMSELTTLAPIGEPRHTNPEPKANGFLDWAARAADEFSLRWLGGDFAQRLEQLGRRYRFDPHGLDIHTVHVAARVCALFHRFYFRTEIHGIDRVPEGRVVIVANHSGQIPIDAVILGCSLLFDAHQPRLVRAMVDRWVANLPLVSSYYSRIGSVIGNRETATKLLMADEALLVFPEGMRGISKPFTRRYQLQPFGHGFLRIALETNAPILPVAVIGAEEQFINLGNSERLARLLKMPVYPLIPQMYVPFGQMPLPTKYRLYFGEPLKFSGPHDADPNDIAEKVHVVQNAIQEQLNLGLRQRRGVFV
jgi:1-acyl-sn-glycerol-3-phosphate acyltransferase